MTRTKERTKGRKGKAAPGKGETTKTAKPEAGGAEPTPRPAAEAAPPETAKAPPSAGPPEAKGFRIFMRPAEAVLWLSLLWYRWRHHAGRLEDNLIPAPAREYDGEALGAIWDLILALGIKPREGIGETGPGVENWPKGAPPDFEEWADRMVAGQENDPYLPLPDWLRARGGVHVEAYADLPSEAWRAILTETALALDPRGNGDLVEFLWARNCDLGTYDGHVLLWADLAGGIVRALREGSMRNLVAYDEWTMDFPHRRPFALWHDVALLAWVRDLVDPDP